MKEEHFPFWCSPYFALALLAGLIGLAIYFSIAKTSVVTIDGCQYIKVDGSYHHTMTHKGDCTNPIHRGGQ